MEDKQYLDEAGLGEVGKVISKFYASKDDIKDLDSLKDFVASHNEIKLHYITQEEYKEMQAKGESPQLSDIHDPISIVGIEPPADYFNIWEDDPWSSQWGSGLTPESRYSDGGQKYLLFNITPDHEIINENVDDAQFNQTPLKKHNIRLQIALGERDQCLYWRLLNDSDEGVEWTYIQDPYSRLFLKSHERRIDGLIKQLQDKADKSELPTKLSQLEADETHRTVTDKEKEKWNNKVDKVDGKGLSTNDFTNADKDKVNTIKKIQSMEHFNHLDIISAQPETTIATGCYFVQPFRVFNSVIRNLAKEKAFIREFLMQYDLDMLRTGFLTVYKSEALGNQYTTNPVSIVQRLIDLQSGLVLIRSTLNSRIEYTDQWIFEHFGEMTDKEYAKFCSQIQWKDWDMDERQNRPTFIASESKWGYMSSEDKKKLNSITVDKIISKDSIVNDLTTGGTDKALSAEQGKMLFQYANEGKEKIANALIGKGVENVSKDSSFSDLAKGIAGVVNGYGVGDVILADNLQETITNTPVNATRTEIHDAQHVFFGSSNWFIHKDELYAFQFNPQDLYERYIAKCNLIDGSTKTFMTDVPRIYGSEHLLLYNNEQMWLLTKGGHLYVYELNGNPIKNFQVTETSYNFKEIDSHGNIYLDDQKGNIYKLSANCEVTKLTQIESSDYSKVSVNAIKIIDDNILHIVYSRTFAQKEGSFIEHASYDLTTNQLKQLPESYGKLTDAKLGDYIQTFLGNDYYSYFSYTEIQRKVIGGTLTTVHIEYLAKYDKDFKLVWKKQIPSSVGKLQFINDNYLYFLADNKISVFDENFDLIWSWECPYVIKIMRKIDEHLYVIGADGDKSQFIEIKPPHKSKAYKVLR